MAQLKDLLVSGAAKFLNGINVLGDFSLAGNLLPAENNKYNLGSKTLHWKNAYAQKLGVNLGATELNDSSNSLTVVGSSVLNGNVDTTGGLITTSTGTHKGIKVGNTYISAISGELILQNNSAIRFGADLWSYSGWGGLKYDSGSHSVYLGVADGSIFSKSPSAITDGKMYIVNSTLLSNKNNTYDLGSSSYQWKDAYVANRIYLNRQTNTTSAISLYAPSYVTWFEYMTPYSSNVSPNGTAAVKYGNVTSWARRSLIENIGGYGWIWESAANSSGSAISPMMALSSNTGDLYLRGALHIGNSTSSNYLTFYGTAGDNPGSYNHTYIGERLYGGSESSELLLFKGNDVSSDTNNAINVSGSGPDRIRHIAGGHLFQIYTSALSGTFEAIATSSALVNILELTRRGANLTSSYTKKIRDVTTTNEDGTTTTSARNVSQTTLGIYGNTYGNDGSYLISNSQGVFRYGDGGPQIDFASTKTGGSNQRGALIFTDNDGAGSGVSFHFVGSESANTNPPPECDVHVISKRFVAKNSITIGQNLANTSYALYTNGQSYHTNTVHLQNNTFALSFRQHSNWYAGISYLTSGDEAMVFSAKGGDASNNGRASFIFVNGEDMPANVSSTRWNALEKVGLQIKKNCVQVGGMWHSGTTPSYTFTVNGTSYFGGNMVVAGNLYPSSNDSRELGLSTNCWNGVHAKWLHANRGASGTDGGITLYNGEQQYGIMFRQTSNLGTHGRVSGDWATYFRMSDSTTRGWVFRRGSTNVASISGEGIFSTSKVGASHLDSNKGHAVINITTDPTYLMFVRARSTNGVFTDGIYTKSRDFYYTAQSVIDAGTNTYTHGITLLNENGVTALKKLVVDGGNHSSDDQAAKDFNLYVGGSAHITVDARIDGSIKNLAVNGGIYWNPYVESTSDASDAASITVLKSGAAGGTELRIQQANDTQDVINLVAPAYIYLNSKKAFTINDSWLRINDGGGFSSGVYFGTSITRTDGSLQVGSGGNNFYANTTRTYVQQHLAIGGTNDSYSLFVNSGESWLKGVVWTRDLRPETNNTYNLGTKTYKWNSAYINDMRGTASSAHSSMGHIMYPDPTFAEGLNGIGTYNNTGNGNVVITRQAASAGNPCNSGYEVLIQNKGTASPQLGGFYFANASRANAVFIYKIIAKIPTGHNLQWATNSIGTGANEEWLCNNAGTGAFKEYTLKLTCGASGSFSTTGFFYLDGAVGTASAPVSWIVAYATCFDSYMRQRVPDSTRLDGIAASRYFLQERTANNTDGWAFTGSTQYQAKLPDGLSGVYNYGQVISFSTSNAARFQIYASHNSSADTAGNVKDYGLYFRSGWGSDKKPWKQFIDSYNWRKMIFGNRNITRGNLSITDSNWDVVPSGSIDVFGLSFKDTSLNSDSGDLRMWLTKASDSASTLNMRIDGNMTAALFRSVSNGQTLEIGAQNSSWIHFNSSGKPFYFSTTIAVNGNIYPYTDNTSYLGTSSNRWAQLYAYQGHFAATSTADTARANLYHTGALEIREAKYVGNASNDFACAPRIGFHWANRAAGSLSMHSDTIFYLRKQNGTDRATIDANVIGNVTGNISGTANGLKYSPVGRPTSANTAVGIKGDQTMRIFMASGSMTEAKPYNDGTIMQFEWDWAGWPAQLFIADNATNHLQLRGTSDGSTWGAWHTVLDSLNYNDYSPTKTGGGASGSWGISITGNAATANGVAPTWSGSLSSSNYVAAWTNDGKKIQAMSWANAATMLRNSASGAWNVTTAELTNRASIDSGSTNTLPWHLFARVTNKTGSWNDANAVVMVGRSYSGGRWGIIKLNQRTDNQSSASAGYASATWIVRYGFNADDVQYAIYRNPSGPGVYTDFYIKTTTYNREQARVITSSNFEFINSNETASNTGTNCYASIAAGATALHGVAYTQIVAASDGGVVATANNADTVDNYHADSFVLKSGSTMTGNLTTPHLTAGSYNNTSYALSASSAIINSWIRTTGSTGWYNETYGGGWYMVDTTWLRAYNDKPVFTNNGGYAAFYTVGGMRAAKGFTADETATIAPMGQNEINFGGSNKTNVTMYFGYRDFDGRSAPTIYVFGKGGANAELKAKTFTGALNGNASTASSTGFLTVNNAANLSGGLQYVQTATQTAGNDLPTATWWHVLKMNHGTGDTYYKRLLALDFWTPNVIKTTVAAGDGTIKPWVSVWCQGNSITGAVWNDYAEYRQSDLPEGEFGYVLSEKGDDTLTKSTSRMQHFAGVASDTWGFSQGETKTAKTPIAVAGRVLVRPFQSRNNYKPGDCVCAAPNGTVDIMTREEVKEYPDRIVGIVSCVPTYEEWGGGELADRKPVKVNGRIWIKIK